MNFSIITASFPVDDETYEEVKMLCDEALIHDQCNYTTVLNLSLSKDLQSRGFFVLAYDDITNKLIGAASAIDQMGLNTYEWSMLVAPMYREIGIDDGILKVLNDGMRQRGAEGELALIIDRDYYSRKMLNRYGYTYSFSEATFEADAEVMEYKDHLTIRHFSHADKEALIEIFSYAFGDLREESIDLINFNTSAEGRILWVAELNGEIVGTVTSAKEGNIQWITALAVHPSKQGRGIGTALLNWVKDFAFRSGEKKVMLDVEVENEVALSVYEKAGLIKLVQVDYFIYGGE